MGTIFTQEKILSVLQRLDRITGLKGAELDIIKCKGKSRLAYFAFPEGKAPYFAFSTTYFEDEEFPDAEKIATIEHEYAHFMDWSETGYSSHGANWKKCCRRINTSSARCLSHTEVEYHKKAERYAKAHQELISQLSNKLSVGAVIVHPKFGKGTILSITGKTANDTAVIQFNTAGEKTMSVGWLYNNVFAHTK